MKFISCTIWVVGALLVIAALDTRPDPPAVNPSTAIYKVLQLHDSSCDAEVRRGDSPAHSDPFSVSSVPAETCEPYRPSNQLVLTERAADPSPPATQTGRKRSLYR